MDRQLQQGRATLFTFSRKPVAVCQLYAENAATVRMNDLQSAHLNLRPCPRFAAIQENGQNKCAIHIRFLLSAQLGAGPYILKLTK
eukprot:365109-Chlamydomonas_euryale.AAC.4